MRVESADGMVGVTPLADQQEGGGKTDPSCLSGAESMLEKTNSREGDMSGRWITQEVRAALPVGSSPLDIICQLSILSWCVCLFNQPVL